MLPIEEGMLDSHIDVEQLVAYVLNHNDCHELEYHIYWNNQLQILDDPIHKLLNMEDIQFVPNGTLNEIEICILFLVTFFH